MPRCVWVNTDRVQGSAERPRTAWQWRRPRIRGTRRRPQSGRAACRIMRVWRAWAHCGDGHAESANRDTSNFFQRKLSTSSPPRLMLFLAVQLLLLLDYMTTGQSLQYRRSPMQTGILQEGALSRPRQGAAITTPSVVVRLHFSKFKFDHKLTNLGDCVI